MAGNLGEAMLIVLRAIICALLGFGAAYWIVTSWIDKRLSAVEAGGLLAVLLVVMAFLTQYVVQNSFASLFMILVVVGALVFVLVQYAKLADRKLHAQFDNEDIAKYLAALDLDPKNVAAHSLLADLYRKQGRLEEALAEYEEAVRLSPELEKERYWIRRLRVMLARKEQGLPMYAEDTSRDSPCPVCGAIVPGDETTCPECGQHVGKG